MNSLKLNSIRPASLAIRSLRYLIQNINHEVNLGMKIVNHFPSLSALLKVANESLDVETNVNPSNLKHNIASKLLHVELSLCIGLILASSPECRKFVRQELKSFPIWTNTLRECLFKSLSFAELEYFSDLNII